MFEALGDLAGRWRRKGLLLRRRLAAAAGVTMVEILVAVGILGLAVIPMLDFGANMRGETVFVKQMASSLASSKIEDLGNRAYRTFSWPGSGSEEVWVGRYAFYLEWTVSAFPSDPSFRPEGDQLRMVDVEIVCLNCSRPMPPVRRVAVIAKL